ncbi:MAG: DUF5916 domain-containing protein [Flavisolibacter sp.]
MRKLILFNFLLSLCLFSYAQPKTLQAVKAIISPAIDGDLSDEAWANAPVATEFVQTTPDFGKPATARTDVKILYDNTAVYVGAYIHDDPSLIRRQLTSRDGESRQDVDYFAVFFDTYNDKQNGFQFLVTTANVQSDTKLNPNGNASFGDFGDRNWDAVWQSKVSIVEDGWIVEMRVPYISLRFPKRDVQSWGLEFLHYSRRKNEMAYWNPIDPNLNGFINQFGIYDNLVDIKPPLRLSFSPYVSGGIRYIPEAAGTQTEWLRSGGMDVKYGINESFTIDATLIPDFGQVVSDNVVNNLTPFEVYFQENRPFFTEGTEIFNKSGLFYSRRVGAIPGNYYRVAAQADADPNIELVKNPSVTQLYNAVKFSGRTSKKLGIGVFNAVTAPMHAELRNRITDVKTTVETEPLANYNMFVLDQALKHRSSITFTNSNVIRSGEARDANVSAFDWSFYTPNNKFQFKGTAKYSTIFGNSPYTGNLNLLDDTTRVNGRLMYKPYDGFNSFLFLGKVSGTIQYGVQSTILSNGFDPNDLGYLQNANTMLHEGYIRYVQPTATQNFLSYNYSLSANRRYLYQGNKYVETYLKASAFWWFRNFWDLTLSVNSYPGWQYDYYDLRTPGMFLKRPAEATFGINGSSDSRKRLFASFNFSYGVRDAKENGYNQVQLGLRYRFSNRFSLSADVLRQYEQNQRGFAFVRESNGDPIVGFRNYTDYQTILSGVYNFTPRINLTLRARHYLNDLKYQSFYNTNTKGDLSPRSFIPALDESYNAFNVDAFLVWDFRPGSRVSVGWKNWIGDPYAVVSHTGYFDNLKQVLRTDHGNELTLKFIYFLNYNDLFGKN